MTGEIFKNKNEALSKSLDLLTQEQQKLKLEMKSLLQTENKSFDQSTLDSSKLSFEEISGESGMKSVLKKLKESLHQMKGKCEDLETQKGGLKQDIQIKDQAIAELRRENEALEMEVNKLRNSKNLDVLAMDEIRSSVEKEKMLRMLDQEGIAQISNQLKHKQGEIEQLSRKIKELSLENEEKNQVLSEMGRNMGKQVSDIFEGVKSTLDEKAKTISCLKEEIFALKENKVFILDSGMDTKKLKDIYLNQLQMGVHDNPKIWFGSQLFDSGKKKNSFNTHNSTIQNPSLFAGSREYNEEITEMESIFKTKLDILEDERQSLKESISKKDSFIVNLKKKCLQSKKLIEENLEIISKNNNETQIQQNLANPMVSKKIREKAQFFGKLLKISYGSCIDLFLKMDQPNLIKLEKKLNNCIQLNRELNDLLFSQ